MLVLAAARAPHDAQVAPSDDALSEERHSGDGEDGEAVVQGHAVAGHGGGRVESFIVDDVDVCDTDDGAVEEAEDMEFTGEDTTDDEASQGSGGNVGESDDEFHECDEAVVDDVLDDTPGQHYDLLGHAVEHAATQGDVGEVICIDIDSDDEL